MCRTVHTVLQALICSIQMLVRLFITMVLMIENLVRMIMQTLYNLVSFLLQMLSLLPICVVFLVTSRLKCFMCGGGGPCTIKSGGSCDCAMSAVAIIIVFFILRATGLLDKIFYKLGYAKAKPLYTKFVPTPGDITECSRETEDSTVAFMDTDITIEFFETTTETLLPLDEKTTEFDSEYEDTTKTSTKRIKTKRTRTTSTTTEGYYDNEPETTKKKSYRKIDPEIPTQDLNYGPDRHRILHGVLRHKKVKKLTATTLA